MQYLSELFGVPYSAKNFFLLAGPCAVESETMCFEIAHEIKQICATLQIPFAFKASYKKANRSSIDSFTGIGDKKALQILADVKAKYQLPIITDVHTADEVNIAAEVADILQIPAFLCRQTDLLIAAAKTGKIVNIKKGQFLSPDGMAFAAKKVCDSGNKQIMLTERGTTFGYQDLVVDFKSIPIMKKNNYPVVMDCTHSLQRPNQSSGVTSGLPQFVETMAKCGIVSGADGLFIETHPSPKNAKSDGANMLPLNELEALLDKLIRIKKVL